MKLLTRDYFYAFLAGFAATGLVMASEFSVFGGVL
jgi:hypothetical protein